MTFVRIREHRPGRLPGSPVPARSGRTDGYADGVLRANLGVPGRRSPARCHQLYRNQARAPTRPRGASWRIGHPSGSLASRNVPAHRPGLGIVPVRSASTKRHGRASLQGGMSVAESGRLRPGTIRARFLPSFRRGRGGSALFDALCRHNRNPRIRLA